MFRATLAPTTGYNFMAMASCPSRYPAGQMPPPPANVSDIPYAMVGEKAAGKQGSRALCTGDRVRIVNIDNTGIFEGNKGDLIGKVFTINFLERDEDGRVAYLYPNEHVICKEDSYWALYAENLEHADLEPLAEGQRFRIGDRVRFTECSSRDLIGTHGTVEGFDRDNTDGINHKTFDPKASYPYRVKNDKDGHTFFYGSAELQPAP